MTFEDVGIAGAKDEADGEIGHWQDALAAAAETAVPRDDCPEPERIWAAVQGELPPDELRETVDHTTTCAVCAEAWQLAGELQHEEADTTSGYDDGAFWGNWMRVAAMVVLLAGAAFVFRDSSPTIERSGDPAAITTLTPDTQPRESLVLRWTPLPADGGPRVTYDVAVSWETVQASTEIFRQEGLTQPGLALPPTALDPLPVGEQTLMWTVTARRDDEVLARKSFMVKVR